jgi:hypothetical protein
LQIQWWFRTHERAGSPFEATAHRARSDILFVEPQELSDEEWARNAGSHHE